MAITITAIGKTNPTQSDAPLRYYPKVTKTGEIDLDQLTEEISDASTLTQADCYAVVISLVKVLEQHLSKGEIVRIDPLGSFQISVKGTGSDNAKSVSSDNVTSASIIFRPGKKLKKMLGLLVFKRK